MLEDLAQHFNIVTWRWRHTWQKRRTVNKSFSKGKTWHSKSIAKRI